MDPHKLLTRLTRLHVHRLVQLLLLDKLNMEYLMVTAIDILQIKDLYANTSACTFMMDHWNEVA